MDKNAQEVSFEQTSDDAYTYTFDQPINKADFSWLTENRHISGYDVDGHSLTVLKKDTMDWQSLHNNFITPGLKRTFGDKLKINRQTVSTR